MSTLSIAIDENNDIYMAPNGNLATVTDLDAVGQNCITAMQAQRGEMMYQVDDGMPSQVVAFDTFNPVQFEAAARTILLNVAGVTEVTAFSVTQVDDAIVYTATILTIYGTTQING